LNWIFEKRGSNLNRVFGKSSHAGRVINSPCMATRLGAQWRNLGVATLLFPKTWFKFEPRFSKIEFKFELSIAIKNTFHTEKLPLTNPAAHDL
jgi:hypothetical protein